MDTCRSVPPESGPPLGLTLQSSARPNRMGEIIRSRSSAHLLDCRRHGAASSHVSLGHLLLADCERTDWPNNHWMSCSSFQIALFVLVLFFA